MRNHSDWQFPWGDSTVDLTPPEFVQAQTTRFEPDTANAFLGYDDYRKHLEEAIGFPLNQPRFETRIGPGSKVAVVVDDPSRWSPLGWCVPIILEKLASTGVESADISIVFGVGRHASVSRADMARKLGTETINKYNCFSPPLDDLSQYEDLGISADGVPVRVFKPVAKADLRILIGSVLPHLQAGFGGGWKLVFPGCSHRTTLGAIHQQGLDGQAARLLGCSPIDNPMRQAISRAAKLLPGSTISVSHVIGRNSHEIFEVMAGEPDDVEMRLATIAKQRFEFKSDKQTKLADLIIVGNAPWPGDPMHSFKVLLNHRAACKKGGVLAGVFWTDPAEIGRSFPFGPAKWIARSGRAGAIATRIGLPLAEKIAAVTGSSKRFMMRWARELVVDRKVIVYSPQMKELFGRRLGSVSIAGNPVEFWSLIANATGHAPNATLFPYGGLTYAASKERVENHFGFLGQS
jgi:nickel-dependent lactate racemase